MYDTFRATSDGRFYEVILKFSNFADCKHFIIGISSKYDKDYLTGTNFLVKNGFYEKDSGESFSDKKSCSRLFFYAVLFFDAEETNPERLDFCLKNDMLCNVAYEIIRTDDDTFWINELLRQSEFSLLGNADAVLQTFSDEWKG
jgi:hypothetical protein